MQSFKSVSNKEGKGIQAVMYPLAGLLCSLLSSLSTLSISPFLFYNKYKGILWAGELFYLLSLQPLLYWLLNAFNFPKSPCSIDIGLLVSHCKGRVIGIISAAPPLMNLETQSLLCPGFGQPTQFVVILDDSFQYFPPKHLPFHPLF